MNRFLLQDEFDALMENELTEKSCIRVLEIIKSLTDDDEVAHSMEDRFRDAVLEAIDHPLAKLALKTSDIDFRRWCA